jgi:hypothetical protein
MNTQIALIIPSSDTMMTDTAMAMNRLIVNAASDISLAVINPRFGSIAMGRYIGVRDAIEFGATHILFIDSDMVFPPRALRILLEHEEKIVGITYPKRDGSGEMVGKLGKIKNPNSDLILAENLGMGLMLIDIRVFYTFNKPWFDVTYKPKSDTFETEDECFCRRAIKAGHKIWCDIELSKRIKHVGIKHYE